MSKTRGRTDDMLIIRGINVFPSQVEHVLLSLKMEPNYQIIVDRKNNLDTMEVQVEMSDQMFSWVRNLDVEHIAAQSPKYRGRRRSHTPGRTSAPFR
ncbi:MAG: hypothetical protein ACLT1K_03640 [[Clostridium] leptum]